MKSGSAGCFVYAVIIFFGIVSIIYIDGTKVDLSSYWNQLFITPCMKNGGVKQYKCKKCL